MVEFMVGHGVPEREICTVILNAKRDPIDTKTLRKHFRNEIDRGFTTVNTKVARGLYINATTPTAAFPGGNPTAQIFWSKTRGRHLFGEAATAGPGGATPETQTIRDMSDEDQGKRILYALEAATHAAAKKKPTTTDK